MVSLKALKNQIARERAKLTKVEEKRRLALEKKKLEQELVVLQRSPSKQRNIKFAQRTARGLKKITLKGGKILINQAKLIKEQQLRDEAQASRRGKKLNKSAKKKIKSSNPFSGLEI